jgi:protein-L-isoaspartate O-methyltransferase
VSRAANSETVGKLIKVLNIDHKSILLDIGCGTGNYTAALQKIAKHVIGIDLAMAMIHQAHTKFPPLQLIICFS